MRPALAILIVSLLGLSTMILTGAAGGAADAKPDKSAVQRENVGLSENCRRENWPNFSGACLDERRVASIKDQARVGAHGAIATWDKVLLSPDHDLRFLRSF